MPAQWFGIMDREFRPIIANRIIREAFPISS
jgi:hypothetical protein